MNCERHIRTASDREFLESGGLYEPKRGERVLKFLRQYVTLPNGQPYLTLPWVEDVVHSWYSWVTPEGKRRVRIGLLTVARQQGKSALVAGLVLYHLLADGVQAPQCLSCATSQAQADIIYEYISASRRYNIERGDGKLSCLVPKDSKFEMHFPAGNGRYKSASSDSKSKYGQPISGVCIFDELAFQSDDLWTSLKNSTDAVGGLKLVISTAGWNQNGVFYRMVEDSRRILSGEILDPGIQPWLFEVPAGSNLESPDVWRLANPSLGTVGLTVDEFRRDWERAKRHNAERMDWVRLKFNSWTEAKTTWISAQKWAACKDEFPNLNNAPVHIGLDAGHLSDIFAVSLIFPVDQRFYVKSYGFIPSSALERDKINAIAYQRAALDGSLTIVPGDSVGVIADVIPFLDNLIATYDVQSITVDMWQLRTLAEHYTAKGLNVMEMPQKHYRFNEATKGLERAILDGSLVHDGDTLLTWQFGHAELDVNSQGYCMPSKAQQSQKIDNVIALVEAYQQVMSPAPPAEDSIYNNRPVDFFQW
jgi:phage terminase large subunit-like protein